VFAVKAILLSFWLSLPNQKLFLLSATFVRHFRWDVETHFLFWVGFIERVKQICNEKKNKSALSKVWSTIKFVGKWPIVARNLQSNLSLFDRAR
jgi:hypothetical protein